MKNYFKNFLHCFIFISVVNCYGQYSISGYLDTPEKNKRVYLSLLKFDDLTAISESQILTSTVTDSLGYFSFEGSLLSDKHALYRIYSNVEENYGGVQKYDTESLKNFHQFIFSNKDTITFEKNSKFWFSTNSNTNPIDREWKAYGSYAQKLREEFTDFTNQELIKQSSSQYLMELKSFALEKEAHPLTTLILVGTLPKDIIKKDLSDDPEFYADLESKLNTYYENSVYALQYKFYLTDLYKSENEEKVTFYKKLSYALGALCLLLAMGFILLIIKLKEAKKTPIAQLQFELTSQEEKVAELIIENKTNKEIATELFISLNTVKTHIRNLYGKLEVRNRTEFIEKFKNHPRD